MRVLLLVSVCLLSLGGCRTDIIEYPDGSCAHSDLKDAPLGDMLTPVRCAAAKGLSGDVLGELCLDMDKVDTQGLISRGFNLASIMNCAGWEIANNKLQPKGINNAAADAICTMQLPPIAVDAKYSRVILALGHQASLPITNQQAMIALPGAMPKPLWIWISSMTTVDQRTIIEIPRSKISPPNGTPFAPVIQLYAPAMMMAPTWTIDSIAVLGIP